MRPPPVAAVYWACRTAEALRRAGKALERFAGGVAAVTLDPSAKRALTVHIYDRMPQRAQGLFDWERAWLERDLPAAPARVLVGGCGRGREVTYLLARGYDVWAFDPSLDSIRQCQRDNPGVGFAGWFGYEALVDSCRASTPPQSRLLPAGELFDAVLLGWISFTHVLDERDQAALLRLLSTLAPTGPILASFYMSAAAVAPLDRAAAAGLRVGLFIRGSARPEQTRVRLHSHAGFAYYFDDAELRALAAACERRLSLYTSSSSPHATFRPMPRDAH